MVVTMLVAALEVAAEEARSPRVTPGPIAGLVFASLFAAVFLLWRSMNRHLRTARRNLEPVTDSQDGSGSTSA